MIGEILTGLNILEKLGKLWKWLRGRKSKPVESVATRFVRLFESHGVHRNQIPRFIGHGLTLQDVQDDASLLAKLDETLLDAVCSKFAIRREWLDGVEAQIHLCHDFYKHPERFSRFIESLISSNPNGQLCGLLVASDKPKRRDEALLVLEEVVGSVGDKPVYRFHLCNNWSLGYWKSHAYLTACIAIAWKREVYIHGVRLHSKQIARLAHGESLLGWQGEGISKLGPIRWHPEDMALKPEAFLAGLDPERDNFGITSGLRLWLDLDQKGLMDPGVGKESIRQLFQQELAKYS